MLDLKWWQNFGWVSFTSPRKLHGGGVLETALFDETRIVNPVTNVHQANILTFLEDLGPGLWVWFAIFAQNNLKSSSMEWLSAGRRSTEQGLHCSQAPFFYCHWVFFVSSANDDCRLTVNAFWTPHLSCWVNNPIWKEAPSDNRSHFSWHSKSWPRRDSNSAIREWFSSFGDSILFLLYDRLLWILCFLFLKSSSIFSFESQLCHVEIPAFP
jgi:hypothetical protein